MRCSLCLFLGVECSTAHHGYVSTAQRHSARAKASAPAPLFLSTLNTNWSAPHTHTHTGSVVPVRPTRQKQDTRCPPRIDTPASNKDADSLQNPHDKKRNGREAGAARCLLLPTRCWVCRPGAARNTHTHMPPHTTHCSLETGQQPQMTHTHTQGHLQQCLAAHKSSGAHAGSHSRRQQPPPCHQLIHPPSPFANHFKPPTRLNAKDLLPPPPAQARTAFAVKVGTPDADTSHTIVSTRSTGWWHTPSNPPPLLPHAHPHKEQLTPTSTHCPHSVHTHTSERGAYREGNTVRSAAMLAPPAVPTTAAANAWRGPRGERNSAPLSAPAGVGVVGVVGSPGLGGHGRVGG